MPKALFVILKGKVSNGVPVPEHHVLNVYRGCGSKDPPFLNLGTK
jgi:hypothetical protein